MVSQFEVYWVDLNPTMGAEMQKIRPCVIVSPKELNDHLDTVIIVPVTSAIHGYPYRIACNIMGRNGEIVTDQIRTIDKRRLKSALPHLLPTRLPRCRTYCGKCSVNSPLQRPQSPAQQGNTPCAGDL